MLQASLFVIMSLWPSGGGRGMYMYSMNFWAGVCCWDSETLSLLLLDDFQMQRIWYSGIMRK